MNAQKRIAEFRSYYSELSDEALLEAIQAGKAQYESDAWTVICDVARSRGIPETSFAERAPASDGPRPENAEIPGSAAQWDSFAGEELDEAVRQAKKRQSSGGITLLIGILVTVGSYSVAGPGQTYVIAFGAIIFGFARFVTANASLERLERMRNESKSA